MNRLCRLSFARLSLLAMIGAGLAAAAAEDLPQFHHPLAVAAQPDGTLLVADRLLPGIWKMRPGEPPQVFVAGSKEFRAPLNAIRSVVVAGDGGIYAADSATRDIYHVAPDGRLTPLTQGRIGIPVDIAPHPDGHLFVSDLEAQRIWRVPASGGEPTEVTQLSAPRGLFVDDTGRLWAIAASGASPLVRIDADGAIEEIVRTRAFEFPHDVVVDAEGIAYVSDNYARAIWRVAPDGGVSQWIVGAPLEAPVGLARYGEQLLITDPRAVSLFSASSQGTLTRLISGRISDR
jgi:glucose/arabinose dehydrogenase